MLDKWVSPYAQESNNLTRDHFDTVQRTRGVMLHEIHNMLYIAFVVMVWSSFSVPQGKQASYLLFILTAEKPKLEAPQDLEEHLGSLLRM